MVQQHLNVFHCEEQYQKAYFPWAVLLCDSQKLSQAFSPRQELHPGATSSTSLCYTAKLNLILKLHISLMPVKY